MPNRIQSLFNITQPSPLQRVNVPWTQFKDANNHVNCDMNYKDSEVSLWCKRDDLLHSVISGNKWRKLVKPLQQLMQQPSAHVLSFGGAYSNHLHALSYCCNKLNIKFTAVVRGAYLSKQTLNPTLQDLKSWNTNLLFVDKHTYQRRNETDYLDLLRKQLGVDVIIPEGGSQHDALAGMQDMLTELESVLNTTGSAKPFDAIILPVGSGASMAGVLEASSSSIAKRIIGIGVLKGEGYLEDLVSQYLNKTPRNTPYLPWHIEHNFHQGGYAKSSVQLDAFCQSFNEQQSSILSTQKKDTPLSVEPFKKDTPFCSNSLQSLSGSHSALQAPIYIEPVYSGKCFYAVKSLIQQGYFAPNSRILVLHTGGLQGAR